MDKASDLGSGDCRFESYLAQKFISLLPSLPSSHLFSSFPDFPALYPLPFPSPSPSSLCSRLHFPLPFPFPSLPLPFIPLVPFLSPLPFLLFSSFSFSIFRFFPLFPSSLSFPKEERHDQDPRCGTPRARHAHRGTPINRGTPIAARPSRNALLVGKLYGRRAAITFLMTRQT